MKPYIYFLLVILAIGLSACDPLSSYPSDPELSPFVGEWKDLNGGYGGNIIRITNEYVFYNSNDRPQYKYSADAEVLHIETIWMKPEWDGYKRECPYYFRDNVLYIKAFIPPAIVCCNSQFFALFGNFSCEFYGINRLDKFNFTYYLFYFVCLQSSDKLLVHFFGKFIFF